MVKVINYKNLNGLSGAFTLGEKINVFNGSNGVGKTTSLDCLAILLFGESFSYDKTLEKHIDKDIKNFEVSMEIETDEQYVDDNGNTKNLMIEFGYKATQGLDMKYNGVWYVNGVKTTKEKYQIRLCEVFKIPSDLLSLQKINVLRCLVDPLALTKTENAGVYNLVKALTNVATIKEFSTTSEDYKCIVEQLAKSDYDIVDCKKVFKTTIENLDKDISYCETDIKNKTNQLKEIDFDYEEYNQKVETYNNIGKQLQDKKQEITNTQMAIHKSVENDELENKNQRNENAKKLNDITNEFIKNQNIYNSNKRDYENKSATISANNAQIEKLKVQIKDVEEKDFEPIVCPNCKEIVNKIEFDNFKKNQVAKINELKSNIKEINAVNKKLNEELNDLANTINSTVDTLQTLNTDMAKANEELAIANNNQTIPSEQTKNLNLELEKLQKEYNYLENGRKELLDFLNQSQRTIGEIETLKNQIENNKTQIINLKSKRAIFEQKQLVLKDFDLDYTKALEDAIATVFDDVKINMIKEGKSSSAKLNCYAVQDDKPIYNYNTAPQIALGCKIIHLIKKHLGIKGLPILFDIVDNIGEKSFNDILKYCEAQLVCTKVVFTENNKLQLINDIKEIK